MHLRGIPMDVYFHHIELHGADALLSRIPVASHSQKHAPLCCSSHSRVVTGTQFFCAVSDVNLFGDDGQHSDKKLVVYKE